MKEINSTHQLVLFVLCLALLAVAHFRRMTIVLVLTLQKVDSHRGVVHIV